MGACERPLTAPPALPRRFGGVGACERPLTPLPAPQEVWRSSFLHHSNRCSCFHWPGASLMLLAALLLLGCYGGQPAGR